MNPTFPIWVLYIYATINHGGGAPTTEVCSATGYTSQAEAQAAGVARQADKQIGTPNDPIDPAAVVDIGFMVLPLLAPRA